MTLKHFKELVDALSPTTEDLNTVMDTLVRLGPFSQPLLTHNAP